MLNGCGKKVSIFSKLRLRMDADRRCSHFRRKPGGTVYFQPSSGLIMSSFQQWNVLIWRRSVGPSIAGGGLPVQPQSNFHSYRSLPLYHGCFIPNSDLELRSIPVLRGVGVTALQAYSFKNTTSKQCLMWMSRLEFLRSMEARRCWRTSVLDTFVHFRICSKIQVSFFFSLVADGLSIASCTPMQWPSNCKCECLRIALWGTDAQTPGSVVHLLTDRQRVSVQDVHTVQLVIQFLSSQLQQEFMTSINVERGKDLLVLDTLIVAPFAHAAFRDVCL